MNNMKKPLTRKTHEINLKTKMSINSIFAFLKI